MVNFVGPDKPWQIKENYIDHLVNQMSSEENLFLPPTELKNSLCGKSFGWLAYVDGAAEYKLISTDKNYSHSYR